MRPIPPRTERDFVTRFFAVYRHTTRRITRDEWRRVWQQIRRQNAGIKDLDDTTTNAQILAIMARVSRENQGKGY